MEFMMNLQPPCIFSIIMIVWIDFFASSYILVLGRSEHSERTAWYNSLEFVFIYRYTYLEYFYRIYASSSMWDGGQVMTQDL